MTNEEKVAYAVAQPIHFVYFGNTDDPRNHMGVITAAYMIRKTEDGSLIDVAFAFCSPNDEFRKKDIVIKKGDTTVLMRGGRSIAVRRLIQGIERNQKGTHSAVKFTIPFTGAKVKDVCTVFNDYVPKELKPIWAKGWVLTQPDREQSR